VIIGFVEELVFRGILFGQSIKIWKKKYIAVLINSVLFSSSHLIFMISFDITSPTSVIIKMVSSLILSVAMCEIYLRSKSVLLCIIFHSGQNIIANLGFLYPALGMILYILGYVIIILAIYKLRRKEANVSRNQVIEIVDKTGGKK